MTYKEVQEKATELGISPVVGVSQKDLEKQIKKLESQDTPPSDESETSTETDENTSNENESSEEEVETKKSKTKPNVAVILNGSREVRRYSLKQHGKSFEKIAKGYAEHNKYNVELTTEDMLKRCSECGRPLSA